MRNVLVLDCTLRDGGYINNWLFGKNTIHGILDNLYKARVDVIECGFIRNVLRDENSSVYSTFEQLSEVISPKRDGVMYAVMIEQHNHMDSFIPDYDGKGADIIRLTFRKKEWDEAKESARKLIAKGYKVCIQPVGTASYNDDLLIRLIKEVNELKPYAFYLVDTLGIMYRNDMRSFFYLIDKNLSKNIALGFHSHNNLQMSFANAQEIMRLSDRRNIIIDSSCYGMGRGVGNLATELLVDYINNTVDQKYSLTPILRIIDEYLMPIYAERRWGYDLPYFLSAIIKCHPNYAAHLMNKEKLDIESIDKILSLIPDERRSEFDKQLIEQIYVEYQSSEIDDKLSVGELSNRIREKEVLVIGPGSSIDKYKELIRSVADGRYVILTNFITDMFDWNAIFISNRKRLKDIIDSVSDLRSIISTSNLIIPDSISVNYSSLLGEGDESDNAGAMLIRLLRIVGAKKIFLAGFDGFDVDVNENYYVDDYKKSMDYDTARQKNINISKQLKLSLQNVDYFVVTPSKYDI